MRKAGRRRLHAGVTRIFGDHRRAIARAYRGAYVGFVKEYGPLPKGSTLVLDISRTALAWAELREATRDLDDLRRKVEAGAGRGNSRAEIRRLEARRRKADRDYGEARAQLELVGARVRFEAKVKAKANAQTPETRERGPLTSL